MLSGAQTIDTIPRRDASEDVCDGHDHFEGSVARRHHLVHGDEWPCRYGAAHAARVGDRIAAEHWHATAADVRCEAASGGVRRWRRSGTRSTSRSRGPRARMKAAASATSCATQSPDCASFAPGVWQNVASIPAGGVYDIHRHGTQHDRDVLVRNCSAGLYAGLFCLRFVGRVKPN